MDLSVAVVIIFILQWPFSRFTSCPQESSPSFPLRALTLIINPSVAGNCLFFKPRANLLWRKHHVTRECQLSSFCLRTCLWHSIGASRDRDRLGCLVKVSSTG